MLPNLEAHAAICPHLFVAKCLYGLPAREDLAMKALTGVSASGNAFEGFKKTATRNFALSLSACSPLPSCSSWVVPFRFLPVLTSTAVLLAACQAAPVEILGAGSTFQEPVETEWLFAYTLLRPDVKAAYQGVGSGKGQADLRAGRIDWAGTDLTPTDAELAAVRATLLCCCCCVMHY